MTLRVKSAAGSRGPALDDKASTLCLTFSGRVCSCLQTSCVWFGSGDFGVVTHLAPAGRRPPTSDRGHIVVQSQEDYFCDH